MPNYNTNLKTWGSTGQEYPDNYNYVEGEQPVDAWDNFLTSNFINDLEHLIDVTNNELIARDGTVAMNSDLPLGGNNIDNVGDIVDSNGNTVYDVSDGWIPQERIEQGSGSGLDADTVDGKDASGLVAPLGKLDSAETFAESDVTTSISGGFIESESFRLYDETTETTGSINYDTDQFSVSQESGITFVPNTDLISITGNVGGRTSNYDRAYLFDVSSGNQLATQTTTESSITFSQTLNAGQEYAIAVTNDDGDMTRDTNGGGGTITGVNADITGGWYDGNDKSSYEVFVSIDATSKAVTSGSITIEWPYPTDIYAWDRATFQQTPNGGSVEVYVEESTDGGSTWTEVQGPISRGDNITVDENNEVRFRADLSRPSTTDTSPTLDSIYRRWLV